MPNLGLGHYAILDCKSKKLGERTGSLVTLLCVCVCARERERDVTKNIFNCREKKPIYYIHEISIIEISTLAQYQ